MKSLERLHLAVLEDIGPMCDTSTVRDAETLSHRWEDEGDSFLTITLPLFAKALEQGLASGVWPKTTIGGFFKHHRGLPAFLRGFLLRIFHDTGYILDEPDATSIWAVRQLCYLTHKVERATSDSRRNKALSAYVETDEELGKWFKDHDSEMPWESFRSVSSELYGDAFDQLEGEIANWDLIPAHGPGAVAERWHHPTRWEFKYWPERLETVFPRWRYASNTCGYDSLFPYVSPEDETPVRVITVPKTQAAPRIIAIEPSVMQYGQQGVWRRFREIVEASSLADLIGFADQSRNQRMAREGSITGDLATLDLSEASDRVHVRVVEELLSKWPHLREMVLACRSTRADVDGRVIALSKFASMGSSLTFPLESVVFSTLTVMGIRHHRSIRPVDFGRSVSVYGDDIICPRGAVSDVVHYLEAFGFKVNKHKSFWNGKFRESCGADFYNGTNVSVVRLRADLPRSRQDAALIRRFNDFRNRCYRAGLWQSVRHADTVLDRIVRIHPRHVLESHDVPASITSRDTVLRTPWRGYWDTSNHVWREKHLSVKAEPIPYVVDGEGGLLKWFLEQEQAERPDVPLPSFESQERPRAFHVKTRGIEVRKYSIGLLASGAEL